MRQRACQKKKKWLSEIRNRKKFRKKNCENLCVAKKDSRESGFEKMNRSRHQQVNPMNHKQS